MKYDCDPGDPLDMLAEEASEVIKELMKAKRFGMAGTPAWVDQGNPPPRDNIIQEIGDFLGVISILKARGFVTTQELKDAADRKIERMMQTYGAERILELMKPPSKVSFT